MFWGVPDLDTSLFVRIRFRICLSTSKKNLDFYYDLFFDILSLKTGVNVLSKVLNKNFEKKLIFVGILSATDEISEAGSESGPGFVSQWCGFADPDPYQNVTDPQHWFLMHGR
jgi:hypothetical protein